MDVGGVSVVVTLKYLLCSAWQHEFVVKSAKLGEMGYTFPPRNSGSL